MNSYAVRQCIPNHGEKYGFGKFTPITEVSLHVPLTNETKDSINKVGVDDWWIKWLKHTSNKFGTCDIPGLDYRLEDWNRWRCFSSKGLLSDFSKEGLHRRRKTYQWSSIMRVICKIDLTLIMDEGCLRSFVEMSRASKSTWLQPIDLWPQA